MDLPVLLSIAGLIFWALSFLYFRSYLMNRTGKERILSEFGDEVDKLVSEIDAATDRDVALVEDRIRSLRALLDEADKRIGAYRREMDRRSSEERAYAELGRRAPRPALPEELPFEPKGPPEPPQRTEPRFVNSTVPIEPKAPSFAERVGELARAGFSSDLIAKRLGATMAEVDLAVALAARMDEGGGNDRRD